jgi:uncharacterized repeat protein (TIGR01451 family)
MSKSVDIAVPLPGQPVEFTVEVANSGDETALAVEIQESLPPGLVIPAGMAAFPSSGDYDPATGLWFVGDLEPGAGETLVVPALVDSAEQPACLVNVARSNFMNEQWPFTVEARAAVRADETTHCVDLGVEFGVRVGEFFVFPECDRYDRYHGSATISNFGPDTARDVVVTIGQQPVIGPNLRFEDADCSGTASAQCRIAEIAAFESVDIEVTSDLFQSFTTFAQTISVAAVTSDVDYDASNDAPSAQGTGGGFSSCAQPDFGDSLDGVAIGPACFIATAAYGSPMHEHVETLRRFRDRFLLPNRPGRAIVRLYYRYSPTAARYLSSRPWLRAAVRWALAPLVYTIAWPALSVLWPTALAGVVLWFRRRRAIRYRRNCHEGGTLTG